MSIRGSTAVFSQKNRGFGFCAFTTGKSNYELIECADGSIELIAIQRKEDDCSDGADTLVAVDEWMVLNKMEEIGGRHLKEINVKKIAVECRRGHGQC